MIKFERLNTRHASGSASVHPRPPRLSSGTTSPFQLAFNNNIKNSNHQRRSYRFDAPRPQLRARGFNARSISWSGFKRHGPSTRVQYLHTGNTRVEIHALVNACTAWATGIVQDERAGGEGDPDPNRGERTVGGISLVPVAATR